MLFIGSNELTVLGEGIFEKNMKLMGLSLSYNVFTTFNFSTFQTLFPLLRAIDLAHNPLLWQLWSKMAVHMATWGLRQTC